MENITSIVISPKEPDTISFNITEQAGVSLNTTSLFGDETIEINSVSQATLIEFVNPEPIEIEILGITSQGLPGIQGIPGKDLKFEDLNPSQKLELKGEKGDKGDKGDTGNNLEFDALTEEQKAQLRGDVGNTSTNYQNIFYQAYGSL